MLGVSGELQSSRSSKSKRCLVEGCTERITREEAYFYRTSLCRTHLRAPRLLVDGIAQRFCQQCTTFHRLSEFDGGRRSCRIKLAHQSVLRRARYREASSTSDSVERSSHRQESPTSESTASPPASAAKDAAGIMAAATARIFGGCMWPNEAPHRTGSVMSATGGLPYVATGAVTSRPVTEALPARDEMMAKSPIGGAMSMTPIRMGLSSTTEAEGLMQERFSVVSVVSGSQVALSSVHANKLDHVPLEGNNAGGWHPYPGGSTSKDTYKVDAGAMNNDEKAMVFSSLSYPVPRRLVTTESPCHYERLTEAPTLGKTPSHRQRASQMPLPESPGTNNIARLPITPSSDAPQPVPDALQQISAAVAQKVPIANPAALSPTFYPSQLLGMPRSLGEPQKTSSASSRGPCPTTPSPTATISANEDMQRLPTPVMPFPNITVAPIEWWMRPFEEATPAPTSTHTTGTLDGCPPALMVAQKGDDSGVCESDSRCMDFSLPSGDGYDQDSDDEEAEFRDFLSSLLDSPPSSPAYGFI